MTEALKIIKCVDILSNAKLVGKLFRVYLSMRKIAKQVLSDRQDAISKFQSDWGSCDKCSNEYKEAENTLNSYIQDIFNVQYEVDFSDVSLDDVLESLKSSSTNEEAAFICEIFGL